MLNFWIDIMKSEGYVEETIPSGKLGLENSNLDTKFPYLSVFGSQRSWPVIMAGLFFSIPGHTNQLQGCKRFLLVGLSR